MVYCYKTSSETGKAGKYPTQRAVIVQTEPTETKSVRGWPV